MGDPLNTHTYDGKLIANSSPIFPALVSVQLLSLEQKKQRGTELIESARTHKLKLQAIISLQRIMGSMGQPDNIDTTNGLVADDLICLCWDHRDNPTFLSELEVQLLDMHTGFCAQGRTHRLYQILLAFM